MYIYIHQFDKIYECKIISQNIIYNDCFGCRDQTPTKNHFNFTPFFAKSPLFLICDNFLIKKASCDNFLTKKTSFSLDRLNRRSGYLSKRLRCLSQLMDRSVYKYSCCNKCELKILTNLHLGHIYSFRYGHIIRVP